MLTQKQQQLLEYMISSFEKNSIVPSFDEMRCGLKLKSKSGIHKFIKALEERGFIKRLANRARAIDILKNPDGTKYQKSSVKRSTTYNQIQPDISPASNINSSKQLKDTQAKFIGEVNSAIMDVPLLGKIAAGLPNEVFTSEYDNIQLPSSMLSSTSQHYALEIDGNSMVDAGIFDGDTALIEKCQTARNGDIVVALINGGEATLKTIFINGNEIQLRAENKNFKTQVQVFDSKDVRVQGRLVSLIRKY